MDTNQITNTLQTLYAELIDGAPLSGAYILNKGDAGLLASLDKISSADASKSSAGGASIAAHVDHLRYGLSLMNRWAAGEKNPWQGADWTVSWRTTRVTDDEWKRLRAELRKETTKWMEDRKSTRLNSSHVEISYAVFCLKKKKKQRQKVLDIATI